MVSVSVADGGYRAASLYEATTQRNVVVIGWTLLLVAIVAVCLVRRRRRGVGFEGDSIARLSAAGVVVTLLD